MPPRISTSLQLFFSKDKHLKRLEKSLGLIVTSIFCFSFLPVMPLAQQLDMVGSKHMTVACKIRGLTVTTVHNIASFLYLISFFDMGSLDSLSWFYNPSSRHSFHSSKHSLFAFAVFIYWICGKAFDSCVSRSIAPYSVHPLPVLGRILLFKKETHSLALCCFLE